MTLALRYAVRSDVGLLREGNEDSAYAGPHLLAVADGMGGYEAGEVASAAVISSVAPLDRQPLPESELIDALASAVTTAKQALRRIVDSDPAVGSMGTTLTAMLWAGESAAICHIGDSRAYLVRGGDLYQITHDHTFVQALIDQGRIRPEEASTHPQRSLLLRALDGRTDADPDLSMLTGEVGDRYLICSDGLPVAVSDDQILEALAAVAEPSDAVFALIDLAIKGGAPDNVTCIVADVVDADGNAAPTRAPVVVGAAASASETDTRPFGRPAMDGAAEAGVTALGTVPAGAVRSGQTAPGHALPLQSRGGTIPSGTIPSGTIPSGIIPGGMPGGTMPGGVTSVGAMPSGRHAARAQDEPEEMPRRRRWPLMTAILALFVVLVGAGVLVGYQYVNSQYYVGTRNGKVAVFRGLNQPLLGLTLRSVYHTTAIPVSGITTTDKAAINAGIKQGTTTNLAQANAFVANINSHYKGCLRAYAAVRRWQGTKAKRIVKHNKAGKITKIIHIPRPPKPPVPADCPGAHAH